MSTRFKASPNCNLILKSTVSPGKTDACVAKPRTPGLPAPLTSQTSEDTPCLQFSATTALAGDAQGSSAASASAAHSSAALMALHIFACSISLEMLLKANVSSKTVWLLSYALPLGTFLLVSCQMTMTNMGWSSDFTPSWEARRWVKKAARGTHGLNFPWGNKVLPKRANFAGTGDGFKYMGPVGNYPMGRSVYGVYDMAGNVSEWVSDFYDQFYYKRAPMMNPTGPETGKNYVFKGGSWDARSVDIRTSKRFAASPGRKDSIVGFRCGRSKLDKK